MPYNIAYYVHHHGAGHLMRAIAIAKALIKQRDCEITFLGTGLSRYRSEIPSEIGVTELPADVPAATDVHYRTAEVPNLHYSPFHVQGLLDRNVLILQHFQAHPETLCVVDVSSEVTQLARLSGIPTIVIRQHGDRLDLAHQLAYESADLIVAPYPESMSTPSQEGIYAYKTLFSGGFSRYDDLPTQPDIAHEHDIAVLVGKGGTNFNSHFVYQLQRQLPEHYRLHIIGDLFRPQTNNNITMYGQLADPQPILARCSVVICNAGHNTIMEVASLRKRTVCIPASRPFDEQFAKAAALQRLGLAIVVAEADMMSVDWLDILRQANELDVSRWSSIIDESALHKIAKKIFQTFDSHFHTSRNEQ